MALIAHFPLTEEQENNLISNSSAKITSGSATLVDTGQLGRSYEFSTTTFNGVGPFATGEYKSNFSMSCWFYDTKQLNGNLFSLGGNSGFRIRTTPEAEMWHYYSGQRFTTTNLKLSKAQWYHYTVTFDDSLSSDNFKVYLNGKYMTSHTYTLPILFNSNSLYIGGYETNSEMWGGNLNDFRIYDHTLSPAEVKEIAQAKIVDLDFNDEYAVPTENIFWREVPVKQDSYEPYVATTSGNWQANHPNAIKVYNKYGDDITHGINQGVPDWTNTYHGVFEYDEELDRPVYVMNDVDGAWKAWRQPTNYMIQELSFKPGVQYTISWLQWVDNLDKYIYGGLYGRDITTGSSTFCDGQKSVYNTKVKTWERVSMTFTVGTNWDPTSYCTPYLYGLGGPRAKVKIIDIQMEVKEKATPFTEGLRAGTPYIDLKNIISSSSNITITTQTQNRLVFNDNMTSWSRGVLFADSKRPLCEPDTYYTYEYDLWSDTTQNVTVDLNNTRADGGTNPNGNDNRQAEFDIHTANGILVDKGAIGSAVEYSHPEKTWVHYTVTFKTRNDYQYRDYTAIAAGSGTGRKVLKNLQFYKGKPSGSFIDKSGFNSNATGNQMQCPPVVLESNLRTKSLQFTANTHLNRHLWINNENITNLNQFTYTCWLKTTSVDSIHVFGAPHGTNNNYISLSVMNGSVSLHKYIYNNNSDIYVAATASGLVNDGNWHHCVITYDKGLTKIYVDGKLENIDTHVNTTMSRQPFSINLPQAYADASLGKRYFTGNISEIQIYATALEESDIENLFKVKGKIYNNGNVEFKEFSTNNEFNHSIQSTNLILNGEGEFKDNTGFSELGYDNTEKCFFFTGTSIDIKADDFIEINGDASNSFDQYILEAELKQPEGTASRFYYFIANYDKNKEMILHRHSYHRSGTETELTQDLKPGDTVAYIANSDNWYNNATTVYDIHYKQIQLFPTNHEYPDYTYSRLTMRYKNVDTTNNVIYLDGSWSRDTIKAGSKICNTNNGGTFSYIGASDALQTTDWTKYKSAPTTDSGEANSMRFGTKYVKIGFLINRDVSTPVTTYIRNMRFYNVTNLGQGTTFNNNSIEKTSIFKTNEINEVGIIDDTLFRFLPLKDDFNDYSNELKNYSSSAVQLRGTFNNHNSAYFDGKSAIEMGTGNDYFPLERFTISIWFRSDGITETTGTSPCLMGITYGIRCRLGSDGKPSFGLYKSNGNNYVYSKTDYNYHDGQWHLFTGVCYGKKIALYLDGEFQNEVEVSHFWDGYTSWPTNSAVLGRDNNNTMYYFKGNLSNYKLFKRALTAEEIKLEYDTINPNKKKVSLTKNGKIYTYGDFNEK